MPSETDEHGNVNNVIRVGDIARIRPAPSQLQIKVYSLPISMLIRQIYLIVSFLELSMTAFLINIFVETSVLCNNKM